mmetsp:Transcript_6028/g.16896  ORF Transcript_6028/g.16896 Transcript_6028/m.16896 type:complete len:477 (-) Transcript_6028:521-1951(-)
MMQAAFVPSQHVVPMPPEPERCAPCLQALAYQQLSVGVDEDGGRTCPHYFHLACLRRVRPRRCPQCRAPFARCEALPHLVDDPEAWAAAITLDGSGLPTRCEIQLALQAMLPLPPEEVHSLVSDFWPESAKSDRLLKVDELVSLLEPRLPAVVPAPPEEEQSDHSDDGRHGSFGPGTVCTCGRIHARRGDRVRRGPCWNHRSEDGGDGQLGTIVRDEENAGTVFVMWDASAVGHVHAYAWPLDPAQHELVHVPFEEVSATVAVIRERIHLSSVAVTVLLRRFGVQALQHTDDLTLGSMPGEESLREPLQLFHRCRVLPDADLVRRWFDACPPCPCSRPHCRGGARWNEGAERHLGREGYVLKVDQRDDTVLVGISGRCTCKVWYPRLAVHLVYDPDTADQPRFSAGARVECQLEDGAWYKGNVDRVWFRTPDWGNRPTAPYSVKLDNGSSIVAPRDSSEIIRPCDSAPHLRCLLPF